MQWMLLKKKFMVGLNLNGNRQLISTFSHLRTIKQLLLWLKLQRCHCKFAKDNLRYHSDIFLMKVFYDIRQTTNFIIIYIFCPAAFIKKQKQ